MPISRDGGTVGLEPREPRGGGGVGVPTDGDPTTGSDGSGTGALSPKTAPALVIGLNLLRDNLVPQPEELTPPPTVEAMSKDRRKRSLYGDKTKRTDAPRSSGINL